MLPPLNFPIRVWARDYECVVSQPISHHERGKYLVEANRFHVIKVCCQSEVVNPVWTCLRLRACAHVYASTSPTHLHHPCRCSIDIRSCNSPRMELVPRSTFGQVGFADSILGCDKRLSLLAVRIFQPSVRVLDTCPEVIINNARIPAN